MASNDQKTELFFKTFNNTVNADQGQTFVALDNKYPFRDYVFNTNIFSNNIPDNIADFSANYFGTTYYGIAALDLSNSGALGGTPQPLGISYELPGTNLKYFYKVELDFALANNYQTWYIPTEDLSSNNSLLRDSIPFNYDAEFKSYFPALYDNTGIKAFSLYGNTIPWLIDYKSGFIQYYTTDNIVAETIYNNSPPTGTGGKPRFSFVKYIGPKGASGGGGGGDSSFNNVDISGNLSLQDNNLMQSLTINGWTVPTTTTYYLIATVPETGANAFGYFTIQLQDVYYQQVSFYAGVMENKNSVIKVISNTNQDIAPFGNIGFKNLQIILYSGIYYLVTVFEPGSGTQSSLLKIILTNNNSNGKDQINLDRYWTLRNDPDTDWSSLGPQPPGPWTPAPVGPQPALPPAEVNVSLANTNAIFSGNPHGISTQPEYFQNDIVMGPSGNIVANDGTGTIDICGNLYVNLESTFNQNVFMRGTLDISNNVDIGGNLIVDNKVDICGNLTVNHIISNAPSSNFHTGLISEANNFYFKVDTPSTGNGFIINLEETTSNKAFKIIDVSGGNNLFKVGGGGITQTQDIHPFSNNTYDIGYKDSSIPTSDFRYNNLYVNNVDTNTLTTTDICANVFYQNLSNSSLLDFSSIILSNINENPHWYDIAYIINPNDVSKNLLTQSSGVFEIYIIEDKSTSGIAPTTTTMEYLKCEISVFRSGSASIHVLSSGNIPNSSKRNLKSLRVNYGSTIIGGSYVDTGGLFQIQLQDIDSSGNIPIDRKLYYRVYQNNPIDEIIGSLSKILPNIWTSALTDISNDNPQYDYSGNLYNYPTTYTIDLDFNPNGGTVGGTGAVNGGGRLMYVNDKDSKFTSNVLFSEDVSFNKNVQIDGIISDLTTTTLNSMNIDVSNINIDTTINIPIQDSSNTLINTNLINSGDIGILEDISGSDISGGSLVMKIRGANIRVSNIQILNFGYEQLQTSGSPFSPAGSGTGFSYATPALPYLFPFQLSIGLSNDNKFNCPFKGKIIGWTLLSSSKQATLVNLKATADSGQNGAGTMTASYQLILEKNSTEIILEEEENFNSSTTTNTLQYTLGEQLNGTKGLWPEAKREFLEEGDLINLKLKYGFEWSVPSGVPDTGDNQIWFDNNAFGVGLILEFFIPA